MDVDLDKLMNEINQMDDKDDPDQNGGQQDKQQEDVPSEIDQQDNRMEIEYQKPKQQQVMVQHQQQNRQIVGQNQSIKTKQVQQNDANKGQQIQVQQNQQQSANQYNDIKNIMNIDNQYLKQEYFCSLVMIQNEQQHVMKGMKSVQNAELKQHLYKRLQWLQTMNKNLAGFIDRKNMSLHNYMLKNQSNLKELRNVLQQLQGSRNTLAIQRVGLYVDLVDKELKELKGQNGQQKLQLLVDQILRPKGQSQSNSNQQQNIVNNQQLSFDNDQQLNVDNKMAQIRDKNVDLSMLSREEKFKVLKIRHQMHYNLLKYMNSYDTNNPVIDSRLIPLVRKSKWMRQLVTQDSLSNEQLNDFVNNELFNLNDSTQGRHYLMQILNPEIDDENTYNQYKQKLIGRIEQYQIEEQQFQKNIGFSNGSKLQVKNKQLKNDSIQKQNQYTSQITQIKQFIMLTKQSIQSLPTVNQQIEQRKIYAVNSDIEKNAIQMTLESTGHKFSNKFFVIKIQSELQKIQNLQDNLKVQQTIKAENLLKCIKNNTKLRIELWKSGVFIFRSEKLISAVEIGLNELNNMNYIKKDVSFDSEDQKNYKVSVLVQIRECQLKMQQLDVPSAIIVIKPPFQIMDQMQQASDPNKIKQEMNELRNAQPIHQQQQQPIQQQQQQQPIQQQKQQQQPIQQQQQQQPIQQQKQQQQPIQQQKQQQQPIQQQHMEQNVGYDNIRIDDDMFLQSIVVSHNENNGEFKKLKELGDVGGFTSHELQNVENCSQHIIVSFIEKMSEIFKVTKTKFREQSDYTTYKLLEKLYQDYNKQYTIIYAQIDNGQLGFEKYAEMVSNSIERDKKLMKIYEQNGLMSWARFVKTRIMFGEKEQQDEDE